MWTAVRYYVYHSLSKPGGYRRKGSSYSTVYTAVVFGGYGSCICNSLLYIYNIGRIIYLKSKEKEAYAAAVQRQSQRNTIPPNRTETPVYNRLENNYASYRAKPNINSANANVNRNANNNSAPVGGFNNVPVGAVPHGAEHRNGTGTPNNGSTYQVPHYGSVPVGVNRTAGAVPNSTGRANTGNSNGQGAASGSIPFVRNTANNTAVETPVANKTSAPKHYSNPYHDGFEMEG